MRSVAYSHTSTERAASLNISVIQNAFEILSQRDWIIIRLAQIGIFWWHQNFYIAEAENI